MKDKDKTQKQLITELTQLRQRIVELEASETERKQVEEALEKSEQEKAAIFDSISEHVVYQDTRMKVLWANRAAGESVGVDPQQLVGRHCYEIWQQRRKPCVGCPVLKARKSGQPQEAEMITSDGRVWFIRGYPVRDKKGNITGAVEVTLEITERKRAEEEFKRLASFPNLNPMPIVEVDQKGQLTYTNPAAQQRFPDLDKRQGKHPFLDGLKPYPSKLQKTKQKYLFREVEVGSDWYSQIISLADPEHIRIYASDITERKLMGKTLRESEEKYRELINGMNDTAWVINFDGNFIDVNDAAVEVLGYSREELLAMGPKDIDSSLDDKKITSLIKEMRTDKLQVFETTHNTKDGKTIPVEIKSSLVTYQGQQAILSIARDITDRKQAEDALRESEERFRRVVETMKVGLGAIDENAVMTYVNEHFAKMLGYSIDEMIGRSTLDFYDEESRQIQEEIFRRRRAGMRDPTPYEVTWRRKDGQKVYAILYPTPMFDADGHYIASFAIHTDITERKRMEEALRESEEEFRTFMETASDLMHISDKDLNFTYVNEVMARTLGYSKEEMIGMNLAQIVKKEVVQKDFKRNLEALKKQGEISFETIRVAKDGKEIHGEVKLVGIFNKDGAFAGTRGVFRDITERKQAEEALQRSYEQLRETLMTTVDALASTVEMKDQYTAGHQSRVTQLACAIAAEMGLPEEQIEGIRMAGLIHDIGKIMVPAEILNKPGPLTEIQYEMVKMHSQVGSNILREIKFPWPVAQIVLQHHERMDGSGYPQGLSGDEIILEARILAVADVIEAMASHRPYRAAHGIEMALDEILRNKEILYDPDVVDACLKIFNEKRFTFD